MKRAIIYARVSTDRQADEGLSIDSQIQSCRTRAEALNATVLHVFRDEGISGTTDARPGFRTAINRCALGDVDYLICWSSSRFARDQHDAISYKRELVSYRTKLIYAQGQIDLSTHEGWMLDSFQQVVDESYSRQVSADTKRSMMKAATEGYYMGGHVPFGYEAVPAADDGKRRKLIPLEPDASVIRAIFDSAQRGIGTKLIAMDLNAQGLKMRGRPWAKGTILYMLKNEIYMGTVIYNRMNRKTRTSRPEEDWVRVQAHEGIVSAEIFNLVQQGMSGRAPTPEAGSAVSTHVFTGLLRCGICNSSLQVQTGTGRSGNLYSYYACRGHLQGKKCEFKNIRTDKFDPWLLDQLLDKLLNRETIQAVLDQLDDAAGRWVKDRAARRTALVLELRTAENRRTKLYDVIETGGAGAPGVNELGPRIKQLNDQISKVELALVSIENEEEPMVGTIEVSAEEAAEIFRATVTQCEDPKILRAFVATIAEMIVVQGGDVVVHYKPECLIATDGNSVRSEHNWLLDLGSNQGPTD